MRSLYTIVCKEWAEFKSTFLLHSLNLYSGYISVIALIVVCSIYMPLIEGLQWNGSAGMVFTYIALIPFVVTGTIVPAGFVQERDRRTLELLLATPASDTALLMGKTILPCMYGWASAMICALFNLVSLNFFLPQSTLLVYPSEMTICLIIFSLLLSWLFALLGTLSSLRARSYLQAQGRVTAILFGPLFVTALLYGPFSPALLKSVLNNLLGMIGYPHYLFIFAIFIIILSCLVAWIGIKTFHRNQLLSLRT